MNKKILIVDDEKLIAEGISVLLSSEGIENIVVSSPEEAIELYTESPENFDIMITDIHMPAMRGDILIENIDRIDSDISFIIISGQYLQSWIVDLMDEHDAYFLQKPFEMDDIIGVVKQIRCMVE